MSTPVNSSAVFVPEPIAIVGMACRFAGGADGPGALWECLVAGTDATDEAPPDRWDLRRFYDDRPSARGKFYVRRGAFLQQPVEAFDASFFGISPREAAAMDPQQRLLLELTWEAFEDGGLLSRDMAGHAVGVYVGGFTLDYLMMQLRPENRHLAGTHTASGATMGLLANRISHVFDFRGPSLAVDTACSSSLTALHLACADLRTGVTPLAVCGGVNVMLAPEYLIAACKAHLLAPDGRSKPFNAGADGYGRGEGGGVLILKTLSRALADGDAVRALIIASGLSQDGRTDGISLPSAAAQADLLRRVYAAAAVGPSDLGYVEAHGTGTQAGDLAECTALGEVIGRHRPVDRPLVIGSVKGNIGHCEAAAGVAGIIKAVLCLEQRAIPPSIHFEVPNPKIDFTTLGLRVPVTVAPWLEDAGPRRAGVSAFGYGGSNAHVILQEAPASPAPTGSSNQRLEMLPLSAHSSNALREMGAAYIGWLSRDRPPPSLAELCHAAGACRIHHDWRLAVLGSSTAEIAARLERHLSGDKPEGVSEGHVTRREHPVFVYTGMGPQRWGMGRELYLSEPVFRCAIDAIDDCLERQAGWSLRAEWRADQQCSRMGEVLIAQTANFSLQVGLTALWRSWGVTPGAIVGHSAGEIAAAYEAGALGLEQAVAVIHTRARLQQRQAGLGGMLATGLDEAGAAACLADLGDRVGLAAVNSPSSSVLSGDPTILARIAARLDEAGIFQRSIDVDVAYHSWQMDPLRDELLAALAPLQSESPSVPLISTVTGSTVTAGQLDAAYWWSNVRAPVRFAKALKTLLDRGATTFLEIGPHPVLATAINESARADGIEVQVLASQYRAQGQRDTMLAALASLYTRGSPIDWRGLHPSYRRRTGMLPRYPWQRERLFVESVQARLDRLGPNGHVLLGLSRRDPTTCWESEVNRGSMPFIDDHRVNGDIVFPAAAFVEAALAVGHATYSELPIVIEDVRFLRMLVVDPAAERVLRTEHDMARAAFAISSADRIDRDDWVRHVSGRLLAGPAGAAGGVLDVAGAYDCCPHRVAASTLYDALARRGLAYGPAFSSVRDLWHGADHIIAALAPDDAEAAAATPYLLHPGLLDGAFQALLGPGVSSAETTTIVPERIDHLRFYRAVGRRAIAWWSNLAFGPTEIRGDLLICDPAGAVAVEASGVSLRAMPARPKQPGYSSRWLYEPHWSAAPRPAQPAAGTASPGWILLDAASELASEFRHAAAGLPMRDVFETPRNPGWRRESLSELVADVPATGVIWIIRGEDVDMVGLLTGAVEIVQALIALARPVRVVLVTCGVETLARGDTVEGRALAPLWGLGRVIAWECPSLRCTLVDLPARPQLADFAALVAECRDGSEEREVAFRDGSRSVRRVRRLDPETVQARQLRRIEPTAEQVLRLLPADGRGELVWQAEQLPAVGPGEIAVRVLGVLAHPRRRAAGARSGSPTHLSEASPLGQEAVGEVHKIGAGVRDFTVGDRVVVIATGGLFATHIVVSPASAIVVGVDNPNALHALGLLAGTVAYRAAVDLAAIENGETVLVHAEASGIAHATIQIARHRGALVLATASSAEGREVVARWGASKVFDPHRIDLASAVMAATNGRGVDAAICARDGAILHQSVGLLARGGRLVHLVGADAAAEPGAMAELGANRSIAILDIDDLLASSDHRLRRLVAAVQALRAAGVLRPPVQRVLSASQAARAFTMAEDANASGQYVVQLYAEPIMARPRRPANLARPDGTYLVTGGLGGFGIEVARWLVRSGARHLALAGRSGAKRPEAQQLLAELAQQSIDVGVFPVDVSDGAAVGRMVDSIRSTMLPIAGVVHSAAVLEDGVLTSLDSGQITRVFEPKALGAWHLHLHTLDDPLDFFVMFSSLASVLGSIGQAAYASANAFLDSLARYRQARDLPALAVNWGPIAAVGAAARDTRIAERLSRFGITPIVPVQALGALTMALTLADTAQLAVVDIDWTESIQQAPAVPAWKLLAEAMAAGYDGGRDGLRRALHSLPGHLRKGHLEKAVCGAVAGVLGMPVDRIEIDKPLSGYGLDSLTALEISLALEALGVDITAARLLSGLSVRDLAPLAETRLDAEGWLPSSLSLNLP